MNISPLTESYPDIPKPLILAGPCSAETHEQTLSTALEIASGGVKMYRAGLWKPRTKPGMFEGVGKEGISWLTEVREKTGMLTATEVANSKHVKEAIRGGIEILWLGARTTANPFAVQEIADTLASLKESSSNTTLLVKNPVNPDLELWIGAMERLYNAGIKKIAAVHRGFSTYERGLFRNLPHWHIPIELKRRIPSLTVICDPSHIGGRANLIHHISQQAMDMGFDGLMVETHINPSAALSDSFQQITPGRLKEILGSLIIREKCDQTESLTELRREIDELDDRLLHLLSQRMSISREIGRYKKTSNIPVLQPLRYDNLINRSILQADELSIDAEFIKKVLKAVHEESVRQQLEVFNRHSQDE